MDVTKIKGSRDRHGMHERPVSFAQASAMMLSLTEKEAADRILDKLRVIPIFKANTFDRFIVNMGGLSRKERIVTINLVNKHRDSIGLKRLDMDPLGNGDHLIEPRFGEEVYFSLKAIQVEPVSVTETW